ncbi:hypothetical protein RI444_15370 [Paenarthrobacter sp. AT5]|uniref:hypothetical protein n=1 Tax=Paenarthrobacter TaxID=1742992 RepID=UPI001A998739|nr:MULTISPECIES: hypothetical protein [Paenarthrobacter]QSZ53287.1 hypothetical protein AYX19_09900 [Paenarthrobacter ureafaciens]WOC59887.1 hypothetical protein RI444_15370 [Paenarthrobacter sp. AT5]
MARTVVVLCGPPGAGKTTAARQSGLKVFDRDDPEWMSERHFTDALAAIATDPNAQAVVIRTGATSAARAKAAQLVAATHVFLLTADQNELAQRIRQRDRADKVNTLVGVRTWFQRFDGTDGVTDFPGWSGIHQPDLGTVSEDW